MYFSNLRFTGVPGLVTHSTTSNNILEGSVWKLRTMCVLDIASASGISHITAMMSQYFNLPRLYNSSSALQFQDRIPNLNYSLWHGGSAGGDQAVW